MVLTFVGTRPEIIRLSRVMSALDEFTNHVLVHTGQNYDFELNEVFFQEMQLREPDYYLNVDTSSLGSMLGGVLIESEKVLLEERPDAVLILGDTNSSIAGIIAKRMKIPIYHMEAGNRCFDSNVPEETNRRIIDRIADFNLVYTEHARRHMLSEGMPHRRIYLTGSPIKEVLTHYSKQIQQSRVLKTLHLKSKKYFLVSMHREENVDSNENLRSLLQALEAITEEYSLPAIVSTHPRTKKRFEELADFKESERLQFLKPFGYFDYNKLQQESFCVLSDSGTISEESSISRFPAVTIRTAMERPESMDTGSIIITGLDAPNILNAVRLVTADGPSGEIPDPPVDYQIENVSQRVVRLIVGTAKLSNDWDGIEQHDHQ